MRKILLLAVLPLAFPALILSQGPRGQGQRFAREAAPVDFTGYWVSVVSEDWRHRMTTPRRGDYESIGALMTAEARKIADSWDLAKDDAAGLQCKAFGVGGIIRQPGRIHITWQDDNTLKLDFDAGSQTRIFHFDPNRQATGEKTWQGHSVAEWEVPPGRGRGAVRAQLGNSTGPVAPGGGGRGQRGGPPPPASLSEGGALRVVTTHFRSGYLRKNGVPYSENARITEYFHRLPPHPNGDHWLLVTTIVEDPQYLNQPFYTSTHFKLEPDGSKFSPSPCRTSPPPGDAEN